MSEELARRYLRKERERRNWEYGREPSKADYKAAAYAVLEAAEREGSTYGEAELVGIVEAVALYCAREARHLDGAPLAWDAQQYAKQALDGDWRAWDKAGMARPGKAGA